MKLYGTTSSKNDAIVMPTKMQNNLLISSIFPINSLYAAVEWTPVKRINQTQNGRNMFEIFKKDLKTTMGLVGCDIFSKVVLLDICSTTLVRIVSSKFRVAALF